jgi:hypothetical protein
MSAYRELLRLAEAQSAALASGDLEAAVGLLDARGALLARAGAPGPDDLDAIREVLRLDRQLSGVIRERMIALRDEALANQRGRHALNGYRPYPAPPVPTVDRTS